MYKNKGDFLDYSNSAIKNINKNNRLNIAIWFIQLVLSLVFLLA